tara:strand:- start:1849 stop:2229 length:381 start_codon:yes stop_codon:yes gene_type:complete
MSETKGIRLPEEADTDPWTAAFVCELYELYGVPVEGSLCKSKSEKIQFLWATMGLSNAMMLEEPLWRAMRGRVQPEKAAEEFARRYYDKRGKMIIESAPSFMKKAASLQLDRPAKIEDQRGKDGVE